MRARYSVLIAAFMGTALACSGGTSEEMTGVTLGSATLSGGSGASMSGGDGDGDADETSGESGSETGGGPLLDMGSGSGTDATTDENPIECEPVLDAKIRDFQQAHPDFQAFSADVATPGLVEPMLGPDNKPVFSGLVANPPQMTTEDNFNQWYNDVEGVNLPFDIELQLVEEGDILVFDDQTFFPIDGMGWGDEGLTDGMGNPHNFLFTTEINLEFLYEPGQTFTFIGDDDLWMFVDGQLAIDLGGLHPAQSATANMDDFGLSAGQTYKMDIFHAERRSVDSTFRIETSIACFTPIE